VILAWVQSWNVLKNSWKCVVRLNFFTKACLTNNYFSRDQHFVILAWVQSWNIFENTWKCVVWLIFFTKTCLTTNYLLCDPHYMMLAWVQSWNIFEKLMKVCSPPEYFHKNMSHEQLLLVYHNANLLTLIYYWIWFYLNKGWWYLRTRRNILSVRSFCVIFCCEKNPFHRQLSSFS